VKRLAFQPFPSFRLLTRILTCFRRPAETFLADFDPKFRRLSRLNFANRMLKKSGGPNMSAD